MVIVKRMMDWIARNVMKTVFLCFLVLAIVMKGMYSFRDMPYFELPTVYDFAMLIAALGIYAAIYWKREWIQEKGKYYWGFLFFMIVAVMFIYFVPLKPFSDMEHVYQAAIRFSNFQFEELLNDEYWNIFPGNMYLGVFWGILLLPFPKSLITIKVINALFAYGIIFFTCKICKEYGLKFDKVIYTIMLLFTPLILYINHVYFDLAFLFLGVLALYLYKRHNNMILVGMILGVALYLRNSACIFMAAVIFDYLFEKIKKRNMRNNVQLIVKILIAVILCCGISKGGKMLVNQTLIDNEYPHYPGWNQFYIGLNEERLGMMDGDFSYDRDAMDIIERIKGYGPVKAIQILSEKTFWLWTQGTYQAQRYGFGYDVDNETDKFSYETIVTKHLLNDEQRLRKMANAFMRAQYLILFALMIYTLWKKKDISDMRVWYYIMIATFLIMIFYELKSRYILHCLPGMAIMACWAMDNIDYKRKYESGKAVR